jgi:hypothetical protein
VFTPGGEQRGELHPCPRGQISPQGAKFTPRGEIYPWGLGVNLRMGLSIIFHQVLSDSIRILLGLLVLLLASCPDQSNLFKSKSKSKSAVANQGGVGIFSTLKCMTIICLCSQFLSLGFILHMCPNSGRHVEIRHLCSSFKGPSKKLFSTWGAAVARRKSDDKLGKKSEVKIQGSFRANLRKYLF